MDVVTKHSGVALLTEVENLENVVASGEDNLERVMVLRLAPCKLTRLVEEACEWVNRVILVENAVGPAQNCPHTGSYGELRPQCHLEQLCNGLSVFTAHAERVRGDFAKGKSTFIDMEHALRPSNRVVVDVLGAAKTVLTAFILSVKSTEVTDGVLIDV